ncbi:hypothetical protein Tco_1192430 [Tanacetum coccineum]
MTTTTAQYVNNDPGYIGCKKKECKKYDQEGKCLVKTCSASVINIISVAICALLDYDASSLSKVVDAVTALSCEVLKTDTTTAFNFFIDSRDGFSDKDSASVDSDLKFMKMNDKKKKAAGKGKKNDKKKKALGKGTTILMEFIRNRLKMNDVEEEGSPGSMRISGFRHRITNPEVIKRLQYNISKSVDEMMIATTTFLRGEVAASNQVWKQQETERKQNFNKKGDFRNQQRLERRRDKFTLLTKSTKEILALDKGKFKTLPPISLSLYNGIMRRPRVRKIQAVPSTAHGKLKFLVPGGIITLRSSKIIPLECTMVSGPKAQSFANTQVVEERIKVAIHPEYPEQTVAIGVLWYIVEHRLNVREGCPPVRQKKRSQVLERNKAIQKEVEGLVEAGIMKEVHYHSCLA